MLSLDLPTTQSELSLAISRLPKPARDNYLAWKDALKPLFAMKGRGVGAAMEVVAKKMGVPVKTVRNKLSNFRALGLVGLVDRRLAGPAWWRTNGDAIGLPAAEAQRVRQYCHGNAESIEAGLRLLRADWKRGKFASALPVNPATGYPRGYSIDNLRHYAPSPYELKMIRIGAGAAASLGPMTFTTRAHLWPASHIMIDDVWQDLVVSLGRQAGRVLEFGALDVFYGSRYRHGGRVRLKNDAGVNEGLKKRDVNMLLAAALYCDGYSERGTTLMGELGTAKIYAEVESLLSDETHGLIRVREPGITGEEQALLGGWRGDGKGNFRFKSPLEALHRRMHIEFATLPGQTGRDVAHRPEGLHGALRHHDELMKAALTLGWERCQLLMLPLLEYHAQYLPLSLDLHHALDCREDHDLEGWHAAGHVTTEYRLLPGSEDWMSQQQYLAAPQEVRAAVTAMVQRAPREHSRPRKLSPFEARTKGYAAARQRGELRTIGGHVVCRMLADDFQREGERVDGAYFMFQDAELSPEPVIYEARITDPQGHEHELHTGERFNVLVNPFAPEVLWVMGPKNQYLGEARRVERADRASTLAIQCAQGRAEERRADRLERVRDDMAPEAQRVQALREHNAKVMAGAPITPAEKQHAAAMKAVDVVAETLSRPVRETIDAAEAWT